MDNIEVISRAVIVEDGKVLLARKKGAPWYFLPGGHVEFGEKAETALIREVREEMDVLAKNICLIGFCEHIFEQDGRRRHEYNIVFKTELERYDVNCLDDYAEFVWVSLRDLSNVDLRPAILKEGILKWLLDQQIFWLGF